MSAEEQLAAIACPTCGTIGSIYLGTGLRARRLGTHSLSGNQLKVSAHTVPALRCSTPDCTFVKYPKNEGKNDV